MKTKHLFPKKGLDYYMSLKWTYLVEQEDDTFIVRVKELPGVCTDAPTIEAGMKEIREAIEASVKLYLQYREPVPEPEAQAS